MYARICFFAHISSSPSPNQGKFLIHTIQGRGEINQLSNHRSTTIDRTTIPPGGALAEKFINFLITDSVFTKYISCTINSASK